jgi:hypothetical protein
MEAFYFWTMRELYRQRKEKRQPGAPRDCP